VAAVFSYDEEAGQMAALSGGGVSEKGSEMEGRFADAWAHNIWSDILK
jgi:hypothetical protein